MTRYDDADEERGRYAAAIATMSLAQLREEADREGSAVAAAQDVLRIRGARLRLLIVALAAAGVRPADIERAIRHGYTRTHIVQLTKRAQRAGGDR